MANPQYEIELSTGPCLMTKGLETNGTATGAPTVAVTSVTAPAGATSTGSEIILCTGLKNSLVLMPFGTDTDNDSYDLYVYGWYETASGNYASTALLKVTCFLGATQGVANTDILAADFACDVFTDPSGTASVKIYDAPNAGQGHIVIDVDGCPVAQVIGNIDSGGTDAVNWNVLWGTI